MDIQSTDHLAGYLPGCSNIRQVTNPVGHPVVRTPD
jgi:hypothetical protein